MLNLAHTLCKLPGRTLGRKEKGIAFNKIPKRDTNSMLHGLTVNFCILLDLEVVIENSW